MTAELKNLKASGLTVLSPISLTLPISLCLCLSLSTSLYFAFGFFSLCQLHALVCWKLYSCGWYTAAES